MYQNDHTPFVTQTVADLASIRSSLLIAAQTGDRTGLPHSKSCLTRIANVSSLSGYLDIASMAGECVAAIDALTAVADADLTSANEALDRVAAIEAEILSLSLMGGEQGPPEFNIDDAFRDLELDVSDRTEKVGEDIEIDDETLEIFRTEAEGLLANISLALTALAASPSDKDQIWEIRRNAHTLKGAAGIVGFTQAASLAHRAEDLLDHLVANDLPANERVVEFLDKTVEYISRLVDGNPVDAETRHVEAMPDANGIVNLERPSEQNALSPTATMQMPPIVRVSLQRIDEILGLSQRLMAVQRRIADLAGEPLHPLNEKKLRQAIAANSQIAAEVHLKLMRIRMVRFGNLETRLVRNVNVTCSDEGKKAVLELQDPDVEVDTLIIDALIEPVLHLIKNAIVHGIEPPETRRLIGKPEAGKITVSVSADENAVVVSIADDGGGLSTSKIIEKALETGLLSGEKAASMDEAEIHQLIFARGLTTADKLDLNAGRGVGMSIVKESIESKGGSIHVETVPQRGTTFTLMMPAKVAATGHESGELEATAFDARPLVLVIDDSAAVRHQTSKFVLAAGCRTITANDGAEALELLLSGAHEPDLIFSDVEMPNMDGWEVLEYLKTDDNLGHIPIVMITSLDDVGYREKAAKLGASEYLVKPVSAERVAGCIERVLNAVAA